MRERIIGIVVVLIVVMVGVLGTLYLTNLNKETVDTGTHKNITIKESDTINPAIEKVYDSVVAVEAFNSNRQTSSGSGFVYKKDNKYGYIMTNNHVVEGATTLKVVDMNGNEIDATLLGRDSYTDIAILKIDVDKVLSVASIGDNLESKLGDSVFTVGTPIDSEYIGTVTKGILSGVNRTITVSSETSGKYMMEVLQTDASINPGNSGGPLVNINGEVIGVTSMKLVTDSIEGMGFAIPVEIAMAHVGKLEKGETIERPYIGISLYDLSNAYNSDVKKDNLDYGVIVANTADNSPAAESGLKTNDIILTVDGTKVKNSAHFKYMLYKHDIGDNVKLKVKRDGKEIEISLKLDKNLGES